jgi:HAD superfamily hydrolase (TIGR01509 family)
MIKAVIFDFGGTVHGLNGKKLSQILAPILKRDKEEIRKITLPGILAMSVNKMSEEELWKKLGRKVESVWEEQMECELFVPIINLVNDLKNKKILTIVLSNTIIPHANINKVRGWYGYFDKVFLSYEIGLRKPDIKAYEYVLNKINLKGEECIFVDDLEENLVPALELGMKVILAKNPSQTVLDIKNYLSLSVDGLG